MDAWFQRKPDPRETRNPADCKKETNEYEDIHFESVFLRGGSVGILIILRPTTKRQEQWVILTEQPRVPACSLRFVEIPSGMIDKEKNFGGAAAREIEEETGLKLPESELINMTELALADSGDEDEHSESLARAMYLSPGGCDEYISLLLWEKEMDRVHLEALREKITRLPTSGKTISLRLQKYADLWKFGVRDAKTLGAWALYEGLKTSGKLQEERDRRSRVAEEDMEKNVSGLPTMADAILRSLGQAPEC